MRIGRRRAGSDRRPPCGVIPPPDGFSRPLPVPGGRTRKPAGSLLFPGKADRRCLCCYVPDDNRHSGRRSHPPVASAIERHGSDYFELLAAPPPRHDTSNSLRRRPAGSAWLAAPQYRYKMPGHCARPTTRLRGAREGQSLSGSLYSAFSWGCAPKPGLQAGWWWNARRK